MIHQVKIAGDEMFDSSGDLESGWTLVDLNSAPTLNERDDLEANWASISADLKITPNTAITANNELAIYITTKLDSSIAEGVFDDMANGNAAESFFEDRVFLLKNVEWLILVGAIAVLAVSYYTGIEQSFFAGLAKVSSSVPVVGGIFSGIFGWFQGLAKGRLDEVLITVVVGFVVWMVLGTYLGF